MENCDPQIYLFPKHAVLHPKRASFALPNDLFCKAKRYLWQNGNASEKYRYIIYPRSISLSRLRARVFFL